MCFHGSACCDQASVTLHTPHTANARRPGESSAPGCSSATLGCRAWPERKIKQTGPGASSEEILKGLSKHCLILNSSDFLHLVWMANQPAQEGRNGKGAFPKGQWGLQGRKIAVLPLTDWYMHKTANETAKLLTEPSLKDKLLV